LCANRHVAECNWLVQVKPGMGAVAEPVRPRLAMDANLGRCPP
jgi:hypothetical protein